MKHTSITCGALFDFSKTLAAPLFSSDAYPWELLGELESFIFSLSASLPADEYSQIKDGVWVASGVDISLAADIAAPCIIDSGATIRPGAYLRGSVIVGKGAVIGNSTEVKNSVIFDRAQLPHFNYVGDSIIGYGAHFGAGVVTANLKNDKTNVVVFHGGEQLDTRRRKFGAAVGDGCDIGCNSVLFPGTVVGAHTWIYPLTRVRGVIASDSIVKDADNIVAKK